MEFEGDKPVSDAERHLAQARQKTITPLHGDVAPEALPDSVVTAAHLNNGAIGNITGDIEQEAPLLHPAPSITAAMAATPNKKSSAQRTALTVIGLALFAVMIVFVLLQK